MIQEIIRIVILPLILMSAILGIFYLIFGRKKDYRIDPEGLRSCVSFADRQIAQPEDEKALALKIANGLTKAEFDINPPEASKFGYHFEVGITEKSFVILRIGRFEGVSDDGLAMDWLLSVDPPEYITILEDSEPLRKLLIEIHRILQQLQLKEIRWHKRQDWLAGKTFGNAKPLDRSLNT